MPRPNELDLSWEDVRDEINALPRRDAKPKAIDRLTDNQKQILINAKETGASFAAVSTWWAERGWPGAHYNTLAKMYKQLIREGWGYKEIPEENNE